MAFIAIPAAAAALGYAGATAAGFAAYAGIAASVAYTAASYLYNRATAPDQIGYGQRLASLKIQKSNYGVMLPIVYGTCRVAGNVIWGTDTVEHEHRTESDGGKGGGPEQVSVSYTYTVSFAVAIMDGEALGIRKIWRNGKLIFDRSSASAPESFLSQLGVTVMDGAEDQVPSSLMETHLGSGNVPAYRGTTVLVFTDHDVTDTGGAIPNIECEVVGSGSLITLVPQSWVTLPDSEEIYDYSATLTDGYQVAQSTPGSYRTWLVLDDGGDPFKLGLFNNYTQTFDRIHQFDGDLAIAGVADSDGAAWISQEGGTAEGMRRVSTGGTVDAYALTSGSEDPLRYMRVVENAGGDIFAIYNSTFASTHELRRVSVTGTFGSSQISTGRSLNTFLTRAGKVAGRIYVASCRLDPSTAAAGRLGYASSESGAWTTLVNYTRDDQFPHGIVGASHLFVRSANTGEGNVIEKRTHDGALVDSVSLSGITGTTYTGTPQFSLTDDETYLFVQLGAAIWKIETGTMTEDLANNSAAGTDEAIVDGSAFQGAGMVVTKIGTDNSVLKIVPPEQLIDVAAPTRAEVVEDLITRSALTSSDLDLDALADCPDVQGFVLTQQTTIRDAIAQLQPAFPFELFEEDYLIKAGINNVSSAVTIPETRLGARSPDEQPVDPVRIVRTQEIDLPRRFHFNYLSLSNDYQVGTQSSKRIVTESQQEATVGVAEAMTDEVAAQAVERLMWMAWLRREAFEWQTSGRYRLYGPCTPMALVASGVTHDVYATEKHEGANGLIKWRGFPNVAIAFDQVAPGVDTGTGQEVDPLAPTEFVPLDIHLLRDEDNYPGMYAGADPLSDNWEGAKLYQSEDEGVSYEAVPGGLFSFPTGRGVALTALGDIDPDVVEFFDWVNSVQVYVDEDVELSSFTRDQILAGTATAYLLGPADDPGGEIFFARTATLDAERTYTLTGLLRARKFTEEYTDHAIGEQFVVLDTALRSILQTVIDIDQERLYKLPSLGTTLDAALPVAFTNTAIRLKPAPGRHLGGGYTADGGIVIKWQPGTRLDATLAATPLGEASERYEVDIYHGGEFVRTLGATDADRITEPQVEYTAAMQDIDFGSARLQVYVEVYQVSDTFGRGYVLEGNVPVIAGFQYWRMNNPVDTGGLVINLSEFRAIDVSGEDITAEATITSDTVPTATTPGGGTITYLTDGSLSTAARWNPSTDCNWIKFSFPARRMLAGLKIGSSTSSSEYILSADVDSSPDDSAWTTRKSLVAADLPYPGASTLSGLIAI